MNHTPAPWAQPAAGRSAWTRWRPLLAAVCLAALQGWLPAAAQPRGAPTPAPKPQMADYIVAVVNQESVTAIEVVQRMQRIRAEAARSGQRPPPDDELEREVVEGLINERAMLNAAREAGVRVEDNDVDRVLANIAAQNQISPGALRQRIAADGMDFTRFRNNIREQMMVERIREREVSSRVRITDTEVENQVEKIKGEKAGEVEYNIAQILVAVPDGAAESVVAERRARAEAALRRVRAGEAFEAVARELSEDANRERGGELGLRSADRLPDLFLEAVRPLKSGDLAPAILRSGAGFHVLRLVERRDGSALRVQQTRARHILLRVTDQTPRETALRQMQAIRADIERGRRLFEDVARERSEDGSAPQGGDLGWASPGNFVPEFESAMNRLAIGGVSEPVVSRFGVHLIQVMDRREVALDIKQLRDQARATLREQKFEEAFQEWLQEARARAYIERREVPQL